MHLSRAPDFIPQLFIHFVAGITPQVMHATHMNHSCSWSLSIFLLEALAFISSLISFMYLYMLLQLYINTYY